MVIYGQVENMFRNIYKMNNFLLKMKYVYSIIYHVRGRSVKDKR